MRIECCLREWESNWSSARRSVVFKSHRHRPPNHKSPQQIQLQTTIPVIFGVLTCMDEGQAKARSTGENNHGISWGKTAVEMALMRTAALSKAPERVGTWLVRLLIDFGWWWMGASFVYLTESSHLLCTFNLRHLPLHSQQTGHAATDGEAGGDARGQEGGA